MRIVVKGSLPTAISAMTDHGIPSTDYKVVGEYPTHECVFEVFDTPLHTYTIITWFNSYDRNEDFTFRDGALLFYSNTKTPIDV